MRWAFSACVALALAGEPVAILADEVEDALVSAGLPRAAVEAQTAWERCTDQAIDNFAAQPEPAETVVIAALAACGPEKIRLAVEEIKDPIMQQIGATPAAMEDAIDKADTPRLLARTMAFHAARLKTRQGNPQPKPPINRSGM